MSFKEKYNEYKERQEAIRYFRANNDQFLDANGWIKTIGAGIMGALVMGVVHGALTLKLMMDFSLFYIIIGYAMANILTSVSGVESKTIGYVSAGLTLLTFAISKLTFVIVPLLSTGIDLSFILSVIPFTLQILFTADILDLIFMIIGMFFAYQQAQ